MNGNQIVISGRLTRDPELKVIPSGKSVARLGVASDYRYKKNDEWVGVPSFFDVEVWDETAENVAESLSKGDAVIVVGRMEQRSYDDKDGNKRTVWDLRAEDISVSLRWATVAVTRTQRQSNGAAAPSGMSL